MNRNTLQTAIAVLAMLLIAAWILPLLFHLLVGTVWLAVRLIVLLALVYLVIQWVRGRQP